MGGYDPSPPRVPGALTPLTLAYNRDYDPDVESEGDVNHYHKEDNNKFSQQEEKNTE